MLSDTWKISVVEIRLQISSRCYSNCIHLRTSWSRNGKNQWVTGLKENDKLGHEYDQESNIIFFGLCLAQISRLHQSCAHCNCCTRSHHLISSYCFHIKRKRFKGKQLFKQRRAYKISKTIDWRHSVTSLGGSRATVLYPKLSNDSECLLTIEGKF